MPSATDLLATIHQATGPNNQHPAEIVLQAIYVQVGRHIARQGGSHESQQSERDMQNLSPQTSNTGRNRRVLSLPPRSRGSK
jgi:hypothetical protein